MEAYEFLRNRQLFSPNISLHETAVPVWTWGDIIKLLDDYLQANRHEVLVMPNEVIGGGLSKQKIELVRKDIIDCMRGLEKAPNTIWIDPDAGISETVFERLWQVYLTLQGNETELENIFDSRREA